MRGGNRQGRFDRAHEVNSMWEGMEEELGVFSGVTVNWYVYSAIHTEVDDLYDIGRTEWEGPFPLAVLKDFLTQSGHSQNERGFYTVDTLHIVLSSRQAENVLRGITDDPDDHLKDVFTYQNQVWRPFQINVFGSIGVDYLVISVDAQQVKDDELINALPLARGVHG